MLNAIHQGILTSSTKEQLEKLEKLRERIKDQHFAGRAATSQIQSGGYYRVD